jgi:hypothetical protein
MYFPYTLSSFGISPTISAVMNYVDLMTKQYYQETYAINSLKVPKNNI